MLKFDIEEILIALAVFVIGCLMALSILVFGNLVQGKSIERETVATTSFESKVNSLALEACGKSQDHGYTSARFYVYGIHQDVKLKYDENKKLVSCELRD